MADFLSHERKTIRVAAAVIIKDNSFLIARRSGKRHLTNLWEFPGGKIENDESPYQACIREIKEELGVDIVVMSYLLTTEYAYEDFDLNMDIFICTLKSEQENIQLSVHDAYKFVTIDEVDNYNFAPANKNFLPNIKQFITCLNNTLQAS